MGLENPNFHHQERPNISNFPGFFWTWKLPLCQFLDLFSWGLKDVIPRVFRISLSLEKPQSFIFGKPEYLRFRDFLNLKTPLFVNSFGWGLMDIPPRVFGFPWALKTPNFHLLKSPNIADFPGFLDPRHPFFELQSRPYTYRVLNSLKSGEIPNFQPPNYENFLLLIPQVCASFFDPQNWICIWIRRIPIPHPTTHFPKIFNIHHLPIPLRRFCWADQNLSPLLKFRSLFAVCTPSLSPADRFWSDHFWKGVKDRFLAIWSPFWWSWMAILWSDNLRKGWLEGCFSDLWSF